ncbi:MAG TPA: ADP-ribose diphosphatase, partial [Alcanivorax sp.]|nr:ADP-ribose diphosphatase [Alcanivorax sp.]HCR80256.1 ADP-ribose diphosphatase [Alcanivorax sp.]
DLVRREAREEAGVEIGEMKRVAHYMPSPGGSNERLQVFVGR